MPGLTTKQSDVSDELWQLCVRDLEQSPWAPWTARAARLRGDQSTLQRANRGLLDALAVLGASGTVKELPAPAIARVAATLEALSGPELASERAAHAREYLVRWQFDGSPVPGVRAELAQGGFPLSPSEWYLRTDVTAHALLALRASSGA